MDYIRERSSRPKRPAHYDPASPMPGSGSGFSGSIYEAMRRIGYGANQPMVHPHLAGQQQPMSAPAYGAPGVSGPIAGALQGGRGGMGYTPTQPMGYQQLPKIGPQVVNGQMVNVPGPGGQRMMINGIMTNVRDDRFTRPQGAPERSLANQRWLQQSQNQKPPRPIQEQMAWIRRYRGVR